MPLQPVCPKCGNKTPVKVSERSAGAGFFASPDVAGSKIISYHCVCGTNFTETAMKVEVKK